MSSDLLLQIILEAVPDLLPGRPAVATAIPISETRHHSVYKVTTESGLELAVKHHPFASLTRNHPYDLLDLECAVSQILMADGCPVPECYAIDTQNLLTISEWSGDVTLDDYCQETAKPDQIIARRVLDGFLAIQTSIQKSRKELSPRAFPGCDVQGLEQSWLETTDLISQSISGLLKYLNPAIRITNTGIQDLWGDLIEALSQNTPVLGATDYNARNIVLESENQTIHFLEFSKLGWDWPERRLVQYASSLGAGLKNAQFRSIITPITVSNYANHPSNQHAEPEFLAGMLDGHHFIFHLLAGIRIHQALTFPNSNTSTALLSVWRNPEERLSQLGRILSDPLSEHPPTSQLREIFQP